MLMSSPSQPSEEHQVGVTSAQERNPDRVIADLTRRMNADFQAGRYAEAGRLALEITARSKDELAAAFRRHGVTVLHLDHEAFGIYEGQIEPTYDVHVDGRTDDVLAAASEFGRRHAQEMVLIARKVREGESDPNERIGLTITLYANPTVPEAVRIAEVVRQLGFAGATFSPKGQGTIVVYHTDTLRMAPQDFEETALALLELLVEDYPRLNFSVQRFVIYMPRL
jgi:hypothetical protein